MNPDVMLRAQNQQIYRIVRPTVFYWHHVMNVKHSDLRFLDTAVFAFA